MRGFRLFPLLLPLLAGCCFLCTKVRVDYELQVRDGFKPVPGAKVTFSGMEGLPPQTELTGEDGRCSFTVKGVREFLKGPLGPGFKVSVWHRDYAPVHFFVGQADLIQEDGDYRRVESIELPKVHFRLECAEPDRAALGDPLKELLASRDIRADVVNYQGLAWRYGPTGENRGVVDVPSGRATALVVLLTPALLKEAGNPAALLRDAATNNHVHRGNVIPVILGPVSDIQRAEIQSAARRPVHSISSYDGRNPVPAGEFAGLIEVLGTISREPLR